jgi:hypothetical protein
MFYPAYNQTVNRNSMARLDFGVEVGMERFGAVHTDADRGAVLMSNNDAQRLECAAPINRLELC